MCDLWPRKIILLQNLLTMHWSKSYFVCKTFTIYYLQWVLQYPWDRQNWMVCPEKGKQWLVKWQIFEKKTWGHVLHWEFLGTRRSTSKIQKTFGMCLIRIWKHAAKSVFKRWSFSYRNKIFRITSSFVWKFCILLYFSTEHSLCLKYNCFTQGL